MWGKQTTGLARLRVSYARERDCGGVDMARKCIGALLGLTLADTERKRRRVESWTLGKATRREFVCKPRLGFRWEWSIRTVEYFSRIVIQGLITLASGLASPDWGASRLQEGPEDVCATLSCDVEAIEHV